MFVKQILDGLPISMSHSAQISDIPFGKISKWSQSLLAYYLEWKMASPFSVFFCKRCISLSHPKERLRSKLIKPKDKSKRLGNEGPITTYSMSHAH